MSGSGAGGRCSSGNSERIHPPTVINHPQLPLGLTLRDSARFDSYFSGQNREVVEGLRASASGAGEPFVYIAGPVGTGKTHLLQAACQYAAHCGRSSAYLPLQELLEFQPAVFAGLERLDLVCLDDVPALGGLDVWERGLFDLFNRLRDAGGTLLVAGERRPDRAGLVLPDLVSRLGWGLTYVLRPLDEQGVLAALACRAQGRGLELPDETARFLLRRFPRDLPTLFSLLDTLDTASLVEQRRLTVPFVKSVLEG